MRKFKSLLKYTYFSIAFALLFMIPVHAYIDPSVMTYAIQVVAGSAIAIGTVVGLYWRKITKGLRKLFRVKKTKHTDNESDDIFMMSSKDKKTIRYTDIKQREIKESKGKFLSVNKDKTNPKNDSEEKENVGHKVWCITKDLLPSILLTCAIVYMIFYYAPSEIYMNNKLEFWFDYSVLQSELLEMCKWALTIGILFYITCYVLSKKLYQVAIFVGLVSLVVLYIHGNYYVSDLPGMDGTEINWVDFTQQIQISIIISLVTTLVIGLVYRIIKAINFSYFVDFVCIVISVMLIISLTDIKTKTNGTAHQSDTYQVTTLNEFNYSTDENFIIFLVDAFDSETFYNLINLYPEYQAIFKDFTYYPDTVCAYPFTSRSIPFILSGKWYENQESYTTFEAQAMSESPLLTSLEERGYRLDVYEMEFLYDIDITRYSNIIENKVEISKENAFKKDELTLSMYKYAPWYLKGNYQINLDAFDENKKLVEENNQEEALEVYPWANQSFYQSTLNTEITTTEQKVFKFIHVEGAHVPYNLDENMNEISGGTYAQKQQGVITELAAYLQVLKSSNVYDNSRIIIMADHGYDESDSDLLNRDNALLMVKSIGEDHEFQINESAISYDDLQGMYQNLLNGYDGNTCFEGLLDDNQNRRFLNYAYTQENILVEYYQTGTAKSVDGWVETGNVFEASDTSENEGQ